MRRVVVFARPYSSSIVGFLISILVSAAIALVPPLLFRTIVDTAIPAGDKRRIVVLTIIEPMRSEGFVAGRNLTYSVNEPVLGLL